MARPGTFKKGNSASKGHGPKKKSVTWLEAEELLRAAIPRLLKMPKNELARLLQENPTGAEMVAAKFIHEHAPEVVNRFLGRMPNVLTGAEGAPLMPAAPPAAPLPPISFIGWTAPQIDAFIAATAAAAKAKPA